MIVLLEQPEAWSLMMLVSAVAVDNAELSDEGKEAIRKWRSELAEGTPGLERLTDALNNAMNAHLDAKFTRRIKSKGRYETVKK